MNTQQMPRRTAAEVSRFVDEVDRAAQSTGLSPRPQQPPSYGGPQRDAINSVVDGIVGDICKKIEDLRKTLDVIEKQVLASAANSKHQLNEHVALCIKLNDEILHAQDVINDLKVSSAEAA